MQGPTLEYTAQIMLCGSLLVRVDVCEEGLANDGICLFSEMASEDGVDIEEAKVGGEEGPVWERSELTAFG